MEHSDLQRHVVEILEQLGVRYFITGSTATIFFGEPRFTNDLDVVADSVVSRPSSSLLGTAGCSKPPACSRRARTPPTHPP